MWRQANCSLTNADYQISFNSSQTGFVITPTDFLSSYEKTLHANAFLTTTPDVFPNGCIDNQLGVESSPLSIAGPYKPGAEMLATLGTDGIITGSIDGYTSYAGPTPSTTQYPPTAVVSGDLNKDGFPDLVSVNTDGLHASLTVFLGKTGRHLHPGRDAGAAGQRGELRGDRRYEPGTEIWTSCRCQRTRRRQFSVFLGNGDGTFQAVHNVSIPGSILSFNKPSSPQT